MARATKRKKAKKAAPAKARAKTRVKKSTKITAKTRIRSIVPDTGPVTLDEARALAHAKRPTLAMQAASKTAAPPASPASVGAERQKLRKEQRDERARRVREYKATMEIMKSRGARPPRSKGIKAEGGEPPAEEGQSFARCRSSLRAILGSIIRSRFLVAASSRVSSTGSASRS